MTAPAGGDPVRRLRVIELDRQGSDAVAIPLGIVEIDTRGDETELELIIDVDPSGYIDLKIRDLAHGQERTIILNSQKRSGAELITEQRLTGTLGEAPASD